MRSNEVFILPSSSPAVFKKEDYIFQSATVTYTLIASYTHMDNSILHNLVDIHLRQIMFQSQILKSECYDVVCF